jgi:AraC-like DNA-binding protein
MIFQTHQPAFPLNQFIDTIIYFEGLNREHALDRFLPDGNTELLVDLTEKPQHIHDNITLEVIQSCRHAWASGVRTRPITIPSGRGSQMIVVAFKRGAAYRFYPFPMNELTNSVVLADIIFGSSIHTLREQLLAAKSLGERFGLIERFLLSWAGDKLHETSASRCVQQVLNGVLRQPTHLRFLTLMDQIGYSQKHFIDLFKGQVGLAPKQYLRLIRFQRAIQELEQMGSSFDWSRLALQSGFFDQAHFIHDFRCFSGFTPGEYEKRKGDALNYVPVL